MKNLRKKDITFADWRRVARFFNGNEEAVVIYMAERYLSDTDVVNKPESVLFGIIWSSV